MKFKFLVALAYFLLSVLIIKLFNFIGQKSYWAENIIITDLSAEETTTAKDSSAPSTDSKDSSTKPTSTDSSNPEVEDPGFTASKERPTDVIDGTHKFNPPQN